MTLDELVSHPDRARQLNRDEAFALFWKMAGVLPALMPAMMAEPTANGDCALSIRDAAAKLGIAPVTLSHSWKHEPYRSLRVHTGTSRVLFSSKAIDEYLAQQRDTLGSPTRPGRRRRRKLDDARQAQRLSVIVRRPEGA